MQKIKDISKNILLALETAFNGGSVALFTDDKILDYVNGSDEFSKSEDVLLLIDTLLKKNGVLREQITKIVVSEGPGSLTGIRIGLATARGLGNSVSADVISIPVLEALATNLAFEINLVAAIYSDKNKTYHFQEYRRREGNITKSQTDIKISKIEGFTEYLENKEFERGLILISEQSKHNFEKGFEIFRDKIMITKANAAVVLAKFYQKISQKI